MTRWCNPTAGNDSAAAVHGEGPATSHSTPPSRVSFPPPAPPGSYIAWARHRLSDRYNRMVQTARPDPGTNLGQTSARPRSDLGQTSVSTSARPRSDLGQTSARPRSDLGQTLDHTSVSNSARPLTRPPARRAARRWRQTKVNDGTHLARYEHSKQPGSSGGDILVTSSVVT